jgi:hypothetical protein
MDVCIFLVLDFVTKWPLIWAGHPSRSVSAECGVFERDREASIMRMPRFPRRLSLHIKKAFAEVGVSKGRIETNLKRNKLCNLKSSTKILIKYKNMSSGTYEALGEIPILNQPLI